VNGGSIAFRSLSTEFVCGEHGMWIKASGTQEQGVVNIVFKLKDEDRKVSVSVNNMENNFVKWRTQSEARFRPDQKSGDVPGGYKLYYNIDPEEDELVWTIENNNNYMIGAGKDAGGKYIYFYHNPLNNTGYFKASARTQIFTTKITNIKINLPVYIGYSEVKPFWRENGVKITNNGTSNPGSPTQSSYDKVQYAITIANGEELSIKVSTVNNEEFDPTPHSGLNLARVGIKYLNDSNKLDVSCNIVGSSDNDIFYVMRTGKREKKDNIQITNIEYVGVLEAEYNYYRDGLLIEETRRFLIYAMTVE
jgi:hypothetical protein